jgi:predicted peptidase
LILHRSNLVQPFIELAVCGVNSNSVAKVWRAVNRLRTHIFNLAAFCAVSTFAVAEQPVQRADSANRDRIQVSFCTTRELDPYFEVAYYHPGDAADADSRSLAYRLFKPRNLANGGEKFPLIVWLHGFGPEEITNDNVGQLKHVWLVLRNEEQIANCRFFVLAPQNCRSPNWFPHPGDLVVDLIRELITEYPIDPNRVSLVGLSTGGTAAWQFAIRNPELFAAQVPFGSHGCETAGLERIVGIPTWSFHSHDSAISIDQSTVAKLVDLGGRCELTIIPTKNHDCWTPGFKLHDVMGWLLAQKKGGERGVALEPVVRE